MTMTKIELHIHFATPLQIHLHAAASSGLEQINTNLTTLMSAVSEFIAAQTAFQARQDIAVDGLVADVKALNEKITALQSSEGTLSPEDKTALDAIQAHSAAISEKLEALDAATPPLVPPVPGTGPAPFVPEGVTAAPKAPPFVPAAVPPEAPTA